MKLLFAFLLLILSAKKNLDIQATEGKTNGLPVLNLSADCSILAKPIELSGVFTKPCNRSDLALHWLKEYLEENQSWLRNTEDNITLYVNFPKTKDCYNSRLGSSVKILKKYILASCALCNSIEQVEQIRKMIEWAGVEVEIPSTITEINFFGTNGEHIRVLKHQSREVLEKILKIQGTKAGPKSAVVLELNSVRGKVLYFDNAYLERNFQFGIAK